MTKKLFIVLVVATMMLASSLAFGAEKGKKALEATEYTPPAPQHLGQFGQRTQIDKTIPADKLNMQNETPTVISNLAFEPGNPVPYVLGDAKPDTCNPRSDDGALAGAWTGWIYGDEEVMVFCDASLYCENPTYPFAVTKLGHKIYQPSDVPSLTVVGYLQIRLADMSDPDCPVPGPLVWTSSTFSWGPIPYPGYVITLTTTLAAPVCVNGPYFVVFHYVGDNSSCGVIVDGSADYCNSYWDWGVGLVDLVDIGFGGTGFAYVWGLSYADAYNICPAVPECEYMIQHDDSYYYYSGYDGAAEYFSSPRTGYVARGRIAFSSSTTGTPSARFAVWDGDPVTGPGSMIDYIDVDNADLVLDAWNEVDFTGLNIPVNYGDDIFFGYLEVPADPADDLCFLSDVGAGPAVTTSWAYSDPDWLSEYDIWGDYCHYLLELEICGEAPCDTVTATLYDYDAAARIWAYPSTSGRTYLNHRFSVPFAHGGRLDQIRIAWYNMQGTPSPTVYVWLSDGNKHPLDNNPPNGAMAAYYIPNGDLTGSFMEVIDTWEDGLYFQPGEEFHVGYSIDLSITTDTLSILGDDYAAPPNSDDRAGFYWPDDDPPVFLTAFESYGIIFDWVMEADLCVTAPPESTFVVTATPGTGYVTPGDVNWDVGVDIGLIPIAGYDLNVDLELDAATLPAGITGVVVPASGAPPRTAELFIDCDGSVAYGDYVVTVKGIGADGQVRTKDVTIVVQLPWDEGFVHFYHGFQRFTNFGALGNGDVGTDNFNWYDQSPLYDGTIISLVPIEPYEEHIALDVYSCEHVGFIPTQHMVITDDPWCPGSPYEEYFGEIGYSNFYTEEDVISCEYDSLFIIGLTDVECSDFSIKIKIYYNPTETPIPELYTGIFEDWDVGNDWATIDPVHNTIYQFDEIETDLVFGIFSVPFYDQNCHSIVSVYNVEEVYPTGSTSFDCGGIAGPSYLAGLMMTPGVRDPGFWGEGPDDHSVLMTSPPFSLNPGEKHIEIWVDFGRDLLDGLTWQQWYRRVLKYVGFYRGDVNGDDALELPALDVSDLVYLLNYLYKGGPAPVPFADQGDVDGKGQYGGDPSAVCPKDNVDVQDLVYLLNYVYKGGPPPVDRVRFIEQKWSRSSMFLNPDW